MMSSTPLYQVDAFTNVPFAGNPAAVCLLEEEQDSQWMQSVAIEMNLSETAFVRKIDDGYDLRWFTPAFEVDLCGHATLASAHVLWSEVGIDASSLAFHTRSGVLTATRKGELIELDFPATPPEKTEPPEGLLEALGARPLFVGRSKFDFLIEIAAEKDLRALQPDFRRLKEIDIRGVIVTSVADADEFDFVSRFFAPAAGVDEDPVTGSAHCCLAPHWCDRIGKTSLIGYQASARGGVVRVRNLGERVMLGGEAVTVLKGELLSAL